jgi:hypothetical protein
VGGRLLRVVWRRVTSGALEPRVSVWGIGNLLRKLTG